MLQVIETETSNKLMNVKWKTQYCDTTRGESCWCRIVVPEEPLYDERGVELYVIPAGSINKHLAQHIVNLHNASLNDTEKQKSPE